MNDKVKAGKIAAARSMRKLLPFDAYPELFPGQHV
jgi:hypothetical protein